MEVGTLVTIKIKKQLILLPALFPNEPTSISYTGKVLPNAEYDVNSIRITGDTNIPVRVISKDLILSLNGENVVTIPVILEPKTDFKIIKGSGGKEYKLTKTGNKYKCTCPGFGFRGSCKHVDEREWE